MNIEGSNMLRTGPMVRDQYKPPEEQFGLKDQDPVDVEAILRFVKRSWRLCLLWVVIGLSLGIVFIFASRSYYTASAVLLLEDRTVRPFAEAGATNPEPADSAYTDSQVQVIQSKEVIGRVVNEFNLTNDSEFGRGARGMRATLIKVLPFLSSVIPDRSLGMTEQMVQHLTIIRVNDALSVTRVGLSNAVEVSFTSQDPQKSSTLANAVAEAYINSRIELKRQAREDAAAQLRERLAEAREKAFNSDQPGPSSPGAADQARERFREVQNTTETYRAL
jgi:succinoglycan biosynthesis transport protein ExoP